MLPGKRDALGRAYVTAAAIGATTTFQGGIPISPLGQIHISPNAAQKYQNGFGMMNNDMLCTGNVASGRYLEGLPRDVNGALLVQLNQVPAATDPYVGGVRVGVNGVHISDVVPS